MTSDTNRPRRHALLCGISEYEPPYLRLPWVLDELEQLERVLGSELHTDFRYDEVRVCKNEELTLPGIEQLFESLVQEVHVDELLVYIAGTGTLRRQYGYFATYNATTSQPGMRLDELAALWTALPHKKIFAVLDFCHAGVLTEDTATLFKSLAGDKQRAVLAACRVNEVAATGADGQPSLTRHFIEALCRDNGREDGVVRWGDVAIQVCAAMQRSPYQRPVDHSDHLRGHPINQVESSRVRMTDERLRTAAGADSAVDARVLEQYLDHVIKSFTLLDLRGLSGTHQNIDIPLDHVYIDLQAEPDHPTEHDYDRRLVQLDVDEYLAKPGLNQADEAMTEEAAQRVLSRDAYALRLSQGQQLPKADQVVQLADVIRRKQSALVLGDPGCGKTTLLRYCALHFAQAMRSGHARVSVEIDPHMAGAGAKMEDLGPTRLPIFVRIASYAEARNVDPELQLVDYLSRYWRGEQLQVGEEELSALFRHYLAEGKAMLLFDGIDEIAKLHERREVVRQVEHFIGGNQVLITSRIAGYRIAPFHKSLTHYRVQDMTEVAIDVFLRRWCLAIEEHLGEERSRPEQLTRADRQRLQLLEAIALPQLRRLAVNPLLLTLLALLNRSQGRLPRLRIEIYRNVTRTLVETWRDSTLTEDEVLDVLGPVALRIHENIQTGLATGAQLHEYLTEALATWRGEDPERLPDSFKQEVQDFLDIIRRESGLLLARGEGLYGFAHLAFQEYFVARQITRKPADAAKYVKLRLTEPRWREPLLLAIAQVAKEARGELPALLEAALAAEVEHDELLHRRLLFVASAIPECAWVPKNLARRVCVELLRVHGEAWRSGGMVALRGRIVAAYGLLRDSQAQGPAEECLLAECKDDDEVARAAVVELIQAAQWFTQPVLGAVLDNLIPALTGPSVRTAATVATLLATLAAGRRTSDDSRRKIASALAEACKHPSSARSWGAPREEKTLAEHFYEALFEVTG
jgi:hypothetical protein